MKQELNYERMFKKLVAQILRERDWAEESHDAETDPMKAKLDHGMWTAYNSIERLAEKMIRDDYDWDEDNSDFEEKFREEYGV